MTNPLWASSKSARCGSGSRSPPVLCWPGPPDCTELSCPPRSSCTTTRIIAAERRLGPRSTDRIDEILTLRSDDDPTDEEKRGAGPKPTPRAADSAGRPRPLPPECSIGCTGHPLPQNPGGSPEAPRDRGGSGRGPCRVDLTAGEPARVRGPPGGPSHGGAARVRRCAPDWPRGQSDDPAVAGPGPVLRSGADRSRVAVDRPSSCRPGGGSPGAAGSGLPGPPPGGPRGSLPDRSYRAGLGRAVERDGHSHLALVPDDARALTCSAARAVPVFAPDEVEPFGGSRLKNPIRNIWPERRPP